VVRHETAGHLDKSHNHRPPAYGVHTVVWHSNVWHTLDYLEQDSIRQTMTEAAGRFALSYITHEPAGLPTLRVERFTW
jgi:hypothetical protein